MTSKRKSSEDASPSRKSARLAARVDDPEKRQTMATTSQTQDPARPTAAFEPLQRLYSSLPNKHLFRDFHSLLSDQYNRFLPFAQAYQSDGGPRVVADEVARMVQSFQQILDDAETRVLGKFDDFKEIVERFVTVTVTSSDRWYAGGDLTEMSSTDLDKLLSRHPIVDAQHFYDYLRSTLPAASKNCHSYDNGFLRKIDRLLLEFKHLPNGDRYALHTRVMALSRVLRHNHKQCVEERMPYFEMYVAIQDLATKDRTFYNYPAAVREMSSGMTGICGPRIRFACGEMGMEPIDSDDSDYDDDDDEFGGPAYKCYHLGNLETLEFLQKKAYGEVRAKVFMFAGMVLPVELTEQIFIFAMKAEKVPLEPRVRNTPSTHTDPSKVFPWTHVKESRWAIVTATEYGGSADPAVTEMVQYSPALCCCGIVGVILYFISESVYISLRSKASSCLPPHTVAQPILLIWRDGARLAGAGWCRIVVVLV